MKGIAENRTDISTPEQAPITSEIWISLDGTGVARGIFGTKSACEADARTYAPKDDPWVVTGPYRLAQCAETAELTQENAERVFRDGHQAALEASERICRETADEYAHAGLRQKHSAADECADRIATFASTIRASVTGSEGT